MARPAVDLVVPFRGGHAELTDLRARLAALHRRPGDTVTIVDNTPRPAEAPPQDEVPGIRVLRDAGRASPGYARNRGAAGGQGEWLVFFDADTTPVPDLLDRYFDPMPGERTVLLAGGVRDEPVSADAPGPARYAYLRNTLSQSRSLHFNHWGFVQTTNMACRRNAFDAVGGFRETIVAAEDADLTYRVTAGGGAIERREEAQVVHRSRRTVRSFAAQAAKYGAGAAWLDRAYPGSFPSRRRAGLIWWGIRFALRGAIAAVWTRDRDRWVIGFHEALWEVAFEFGRARSVEMK